MNHHHSIITTKIKQIESIISQDEGGRGMKSLIVPDDLYHAAEQIITTLMNKDYKSKNIHDTNDGSSSSSSSSGIVKHILLLSGFPCCITHTPPTETDGPPGTIAIAKCILGLAKVQKHSNYHVRIVTDECNKDVFQATIDAHSTFENSSSKQQDEPKIELQTFPSEQQMTKDHYEQMDELIKDKCDVLISCERAGPGKDDNCYTMRGINMSSMNLIAPLHYMVDKLREYNESCASNLNQSSSLSSSKKFIAIGDGGNELGMGKVIHQIYNNPNIPNGELIGAVTSADYLIVASVSNWGAYALAASCALMCYYYHQDLENNIDESAKKCTNPDDDNNDDDDVVVVVNEMNNKRSNIKYWIDQCVPSKQHEIYLLRRCVDAGCRDGVSGKMESTVDGMPLEKSLDCLQRIVDTCLSSS